MSFSSTNSHMPAWKAWFLAARPKTLVASIVPVAIAASLSWVDERRFVIAWYGPMIWSLLFAVLMQINANLVNDYLDFKRGIDDELREGPERACANGWIKPRNMLIGIAIITLLAAGCGFQLWCWGGDGMLVIGALCVLCCVLYSTPLSHYGVGDLMVIAFYGIVPVCVPYYITMGFVTLECFLLSIGTGVVIDTLLWVNNIRDIEDDEWNGKRTLAVVLGLSVSDWIYVFMGFIPVLLGTVHLWYGHLMVSFFLFIYLFFHCRTAERMIQAEFDGNYHGILEANARNIVIYGVCVCAGLLLFMDTFDWY